LARAHTIVWPVGEQGILETAHVVVELGVGQAALEVDLLLENGLHNAHRGQHTRLVRLGVRQGRAAVCFVVLRLQQKPNWQMHKENIVRAAHLGV
jgi:hypothetical protein